MPEHEITCRFCPTVPTGFICDECGKKREKVRCLRFRGNKQFSDACWAEINSDGKLDIFRFGGERYPGGLDMDIVRKHLASGNWVDVPYDPAWLKEEERT